MRFREIFTIRSFPLEQIRHRIQTKAVNADITPEINYLENFLLHPWVIIIEIGLVMKKTMPVILLSHFVPTPVAGFEILENDPNIFVLRGVIAPNVIVSLFRTFGGISRGLEPPVLIRSMIDDELRDHFDITSVCFLQKFLKIFDLAVRRIDAVIVSDVVPIILKRRRIKRQQPDSGYPQFF